MLQEAPDSPRRRCYACGEDNNEGLRIDFRLEGRKAIGLFSPRNAHQGYPGAMHGGVAAAALDKAMAWAAIGSGHWGTTARLDVRFRKALPLQGSLVVTAEVVRERARWLEVHGRLSSEGGDLLAEASGLLQKATQQESKDLDKLYFLKGGDTVE